MSNKMKDLLSNTSAPVKVDKCLEILSIHSDIKEAIKLSKWNYGLEHYSKQANERRFASIHDASTKKYYLCRDRRWPDSESHVWYETDLGKTGRILHRFDWNGCIHNGAAAVAEIREKENEIVFTPYQYDREQLRATRHLWTVSS